MNFGQAIEALNVGKKVTRAGWNGRGMYLFLAGGSMSVSYDVPRIEIVNVPERLQIVPAICMRTAQDTIVVGWLASQTDMLAEDWQIAS